MIQKISAPISVHLIYDHHRRVVAPKQIFWDGRLYPILKIGFHHTERVGRTLMHIFSVASDHLFFRLRLDTDTLFWTLEEISDGLAD